MSYDVFDNATFAADRRYHTYAGASVSRTVIMPVLRLMVLLKVRGLGILTSSLRI